MVNDENIKKYFFAGISLLLSICFIVLSLKYSEIIEGWNEYGYIGLFAGCFVTNATLFMPTMSVSLVVALAYSMNPLLCGIVGGCGAAVGELVGYWVGRSGRSILKDNGRLTKIELFTKKNTFLSVLLFSFLPMPIFDIVGMACGISRVKLLSFFVPCFLGKISKMILLAYIGVKGIIVFANYIR